MNKKKQLRSLAEVPEDIQFQIFLKLPTSCLLICQRVCKPFYRVIKNPAFLKTHTARIGSTTDLTSESLILEYGDINPDIGYTHCHNKLLSIDNTSRNVRSTSVLEPEIVINEDTGLFVVGSCNGLICFNVCISAKWDDIYLLWNPVTRQTRYLPRPHEKISSDFPVEFGFVQETNDYMVVKMGSIRQLNGVCEVQLYKMSTDSWTTVYCDMVDGVASGSYIKIEGEATPAFTNGSFHWIAGSSDYIVSFNLNNEELRLIRAVDRGISRCRGKVAVVEESLAMIYYNLRNSFQIWVMNDYGVPDSWVLRFQIVSDNLSESLYPVGYFKNGFMIITLDCLNYLLDLKTNECHKIPKLDCCELIGFWSFVPTLAPVR